MNAVAALRPRRPMINSVWIPRANKLALCGRRKSGLIDKLFVSSFVQCFCVSDVCGHGT